MYTCRLSIRRASSFASHTCRTNTLEFVRHLPCKIQYLCRIFNGKTFRSGRSLQWAKCIHTGCNNHCSVRSTDTSPSVNLHPTPSAAVVPSTADGESEATTAAPSELFTSNLSADDQRRLQLLRMELEVFRQSGYDVPRKLSDDHWTEVMGMISKYRRLKYYRYLCIREYRKEKEKAEKERRQLELVEVRKQREETPFDGLEYGLARNTIFIRLTESTMAQTYNWWLCQAIMFGQKLVVDFGYGQHMVKREQINCADQIKEVYGWNRQNRQPFDLHFCNLYKEDELHKSILKSIPNMYCDNFLVTATEKSYLDLFPKEKLVYLTPHCTEDLMEYDHDAIYIIGGIVDKTVQKPLSLAKAKKEGIRMARLPLDHYLEWGSGNKSLTLDQMLKIMLDIKNTGDWNIALKHIPKRKLKDETVEAERSKFNNRLRKMRLYSDR